MNGAGEFIEIQSSAEGNTFSKNLFDEMLKLAYKGIGELLIIQQETLGAWLCLR
jgi:ribonuclease PH